MNNICLLTNWLRSIVWVERFNKNLNFDFQSPAVRWLWRNVKRHFEPSRHFLSSGQRAYARSQASILTAITFETFYSIIRVGLCWKKVSFFRIYRFCDNWKVNFFWHLWGFWVFFNSFETFVWFFISIVEFEGFKMISCLLYGFY